jgi:hypothetical protein
MIGSITLIVSMFALLLLLYAHCNANITSYESAYSVAITKLAVVVVVVLHGGLGLYLTLRCAPGLIDSLYVLVRSILLMGIFVRIGSIAL